MWAAIAIGAAVTAAPLHAAQIRPGGLCWPAGQVASFQLADPDAFQLPAAAISWDLGDGSKEFGPTALHVFSSPGLQRVSVEVQRGGEVSVAHQLLFVSRSGSAPRPRCAIFRLAEVRPGGVGEAGRLTASGRVVLPNGEPAPGRVVGLRNPRGQVVARTTSTGDGRIQFPEPMPDPGRWRLSLLDDEPGNGPDVALDRRLRVVARGPRGPVGPGVDLVVGGRLIPRIGGKLVQLEFRAEGSWRPVTQTRTREGGAFSLRYRFRRTGNSYTVIMRVSAPRDRGWPYPTTGSRPFPVRVAG